MNYRLEHVTYSPSLSFDSYVLLLMSSGAVNLFICGVQYTEVITLYTEFYLINNSVNIICFDTMQ